jgi:hypothetical protein
MAGAFARRLRARQLVLTHFSGRYIDRREARRTACAADRAWSVNGQRRIDGRPQWLDGSWSALYLRASCDRRRLHGMVLPRCCLCSW